jgi:hypothetical protein
MISALASAPSLVISQAKVTSSNGQLFMLYNTTSQTLDMSKYQLEYFNNYDLSKVTSSRLITLSGSLAPHSYYLVNDSTLALCMSAVVSSQSLGFSSTAGFVGLSSLSQTSFGGMVTKNLQDYFAWSKTQVAGVQTLPADTSATLLRQPLSANNNPEIHFAGEGSWLAVKADPTNPCAYMTVGLSGQTKSIEVGSDHFLLPSTDPPFTIVNDPLSITDTTGQIVVAVDRNKGLMKPVINELLPNPNGTGNDSTDEYIELYNPNPKPFDLSGFTLKSGITTTRSYVFPEGTTLPALSFKAYYSSQTKLSLSNTFSGAELLDPWGGSVSNSEEYSSAKDGQSWALANGVWSWTITPTPDKANILHAPSAKKTASKKSSTKAKNTSTTKPKNESRVLGASTKSNFDELENSTPVHMWTIALVGSLALLYAGYEYRADLANKIFELRRNLKTWRVRRQ